MTLVVEPAPAGYSDWPGVLDLLRRSFAYMEGRIDPPSSLNRIDLAELMKKAREETALLAFDDGVLVGCAFVRAAGDCLYLGKLAVDRAARGRGVARRLLEAAESRARDEGLGFIELQTRIELTENHETFRRLGFRKTAETAHEGYDRPTSITMRRAVVPAG